MCSKNTVISKEFIVGSQYKYLEVVFKVRKHWRDLEKEQCYKACFQIISSKDAGAYLNHNTICIFWMKAEYQLCMR